jgi:peptide/nickel transport system ATP-binding protein
LLGSIPPMDRDIDRLTAIEGSVPAPNRLPPGCRFAPRCSYAKEACRRIDPPLIGASTDHRVACIRHTGFALPAEAA